MEAFNNNVNSIYASLVSMTTTYEECMACNTSLVSELTDYKHRLKEEQCKTSSLLNDLEILRRENVSLISRVENLEADRREFAKVSHVVALEKENARLKAELTKNIDQLKAKVVTFTESVSVQTTVTQEHQQDNYREDTLLAHQAGNEGIVDTNKEVNNDTQTSNNSTVVSEPSERFKTKKINGIFYYINVDSNVIYERTEDGELGDELGVLRKEGRKTIVVWH